MPWAPRQAWEALSPRQKVLGFLAVLGGALAGFTLMTWLYGATDTDLREVRRFAELQPGVRRILGDPAALGTEGATCANEYGFGDSWRVELDWRLKAPKSTEAARRSFGRLVVAGDRILSRRRILKAEFRSPDGKAIDLKKEAEAWFLRGERP